MTWTSSISSTHPSHELHGEEGRLNIGITSGVLADGCIGGLGRGQGDLLLRLWGHGLGGSSGGGLGFHHTIHA